jgi:hypothetical protein
LPPHEHAPAALHPSARFVSHAVHAAPLLPHAPRFGAVQVVPLQQPAVHELESHTHWPPLQCCPEMHAGPEPHWQPLAPHVSVADVLQLTQAAPPAPHVVSDEVTHAPLWQQPVHVDPLHVHVPPAHCSPVAHCPFVPHVHLPVAASQPSDTLGSQAWHVAPPSPHAVLLGVTHCNPWQHPLGHEAAVHEHLPWTHCWPLPHALVAVPHTHVPAALHVSPTFGSHVVQVAPLAPHVVTPAVSHVVPLQQPVVHDVESHTHWPPTHRCPVLHGVLQPEAAS